jgi:hypothetical protein
VSIRSAAAIGGLAVVALTVAAGAAWVYRDSPTVRNWAHQASVAASALGATAGSTAGLHKCVQGSQVLYTDGACPAGTRPLAVTGGAVTVVPGTRAAAPAASVPNVRDLLVPKEETSLRDKMMERTIDNLGK